MRRNSELFYCCKLLKSAYKPCFAPNCKKIEKSQRQTPRDNYIPIGSIQNHVFTQLCSVWVYLKYGEIRTVTNT